MACQSLSPVGFFGAAVVALGMSIAAAPVLAQGAAVDAAQITFWQSVRDTKNPVELEAYLSAYPNGKFAPLAKIRLKALRAPKAQNKAKIDKKPAPKPAVAEATVAYRFGEPGWLGVSVANTSLTGRLKQIAGRAAAVRIDQVTNKGPAQKGGLRRNDIIVTIGGTPQTNIRVLIDKIAALTPGITVNFSIIRSLKNIEIPIKIGGKFTDALVLARAGDASAQVDVGIAYALGELVEKDEVEARRWYAKAADQGNRHALNNLGNIYWYGRGVPKDEYRAIEWYRRAAEKGHAAAQTHIGYAYANGQGAQRSDRKAVEWYQKAAAQNEPFALNNLALLYEDGRGGLRKSRGKAIELFRRAAGLGNKMAINNLKKRRVAAYDLAEIQRLLAELGYAPGPADAKMGRKTRAAIRAFQADAGMSANGKATLNLATRLRGAKDRAGRPAAPEPSASPTPTVKAPRKAPSEEIKDLDALD